MNGQASKRWRLACGAAVVALSLAGAAQAQVKSFNVPAQPAVRAIPEFARQAGVQIIAPAGQLGGVVTPAVRGDLDVRDALRRLIAGAGLEVASDTGSVITLRRTGPAAAPRPQGVSTTLGEDLSELVVTGSRIRGVAPSSPVVTFRASDLAEAGFSNLGELLRSIPQNFSGGQNPGIVNGSSGRSLANQNVSGGSSLNLRGLGPDATLTLINGRRLSYDGLAQAVDISFIPVGALDQIQVVADGASAIYGSDAVAGVANVILKRDMQGLIAQARYGGATDGGDVTAQASVTLGDRWSSGGVLAALQYDRNTPIWTTQRSFTSGIAGPLALLPEVAQWSGVVSVHQDLGDRVEVSLDALGADRHMQRVTTYPTSGFTSATHVQSFALAPAAHIQAPLDWTVDASGVLARNRNVYATRNYSTAGGLLSYSRGCYCNAARQAEITAEGPLFSLPGGVARMAIGGGYRHNAFDSPGGDGGDISSRYGYGELNLPLVSPAMALPGVERLTLNGAVRYETYDTLGDVTTPKVGVVYSPLAGLQLKASWGKSFKAPTLLQQYQERYIAVFPANFFDASIPADRQALLIGGGSGALKPEKADTFTAGVVFEPGALPGLRVEATYFNIDYEDRVVEPIADFSLAFVDPRYAPYVVRNPSAAQIQSTVDAAGYLYTLTGPYDPAKVVAILDDSSQNAARQRIKGVDLDVRYVLSLGGGALTAQATGSWLRLVQQDSALSPAVRLSGTPFNPPRFRARGGLTWRRDGLTLAGFVNRQSEMEDTGRVPAATVAGQTSLDLTGLYRFTADGPLRDLELGVSALNVTNEQPPFVRANVTYVPGFDSTNYSAVGRYVSVSLTKRF